MSNGHREQLRSPLKDENEDDDKDCLWMGHISFPFSPLIPLCGLDFALARHNSNKFDSALA